MGDPTFPETLHGQDIDGLGVLTGGQRLLVVEGQAVSHRCSESSSQWERQQREGSINIFILLLVLKEPTASAAVDGCGPEGLIFDRSDKRAEGKRKGYQKRKIRGRRRESGLSQASRDKACSDHSRAGSMQGEGKV